MQTDGELLISFLSFLDSKIQGLHEPLPQPLVAQILSEVSPLGRHTSGASDLGETGSCKAPKVSAPDVLLDKHGSCS